MERNSNIRRGSSRMVVSSMTPSYKVGLFFIDTFFWAVTLGIFFFFWDTLTDWSGYKSILGLVWRLFLLFIALSCVAGFYAYNYHHALKITVRNGMVTIKRYVIPWMYTHYVIKNDFGGYYNVEEIHTNDGKTTTTEAFWFVKKGRLKLRIEEKAYENTDSIVDAIGVECLGSLKVTEVDSFLSGTKLIE